MSFFCFCFSALLRFRLPRHGCSSPPHIFSWSDTSLFRCCCLSEEHRHRGLASINYLWILLRSYLTGNLSARESLAVARVWFRRRWLLTTIPGQATMEDLRLLVDRQQRLHVKNMKLGKLVIQFLRTRQHSL